MSTKNEIHFIEEINANHEQLSPQARTHVDHCSLCRAELRMMEHVARGIATLPRRAVPASLKMRVFRKLMEPAYKLWHILAGAAVVLISPALLKYLSGSYAGFNLSEATMIFLFGLYGVLIGLVLLPLSFKLFRDYSDDMHSFEAGMDDMMDHPIRTIAGYLRRNKA